MYGFGDESQEGEKQEEGKEEEEEKEEHDGDMMAWQPEIASESSETEESCECKICGSDQRFNDSFPNIE